MYQMNRIFNVGDTYLCDKGHMNLTFEILEIDGHNLTIQWGDKKLVRTISQMCEVVDTFEYRQIE